MNQDGLNQKAKDIINSNKYLSLATTDKLKPWVAPVFYCKDDKYNFYFISQPDSIHIKHLEFTSEVAFAIFDSHQEEGKGNGVQGSAKVEWLEGDLVIEGLKYYSTSFIEMTAESLQAPSPYRLYKMIPEQVFILDAEADVDKRVEVYLQ